MSPGIYLFITKHPEDISHLREYLEPLSSGCTFEILRVDTCQEGYSLLADEAISKIFCRTDSCNFTFFENVCLDYPDVRIYLFFPNENSSPGIPIWSIRGIDPGTIPVKTPTPSANESISKKNILQTDDMSLLCQCSSLLGKLGNRLNHDLRKMQAVYKLAFEITNDPQSNHSLIEAARKNIENENATFSAISATLGLFDPPVQRSKTRFGDIFTTELLKNSNVVLDAFTGLPDSSIEVDLPLVRTAFVKLFDFCRTVRKTDDPIVMKTLVDNDAIVVSMSETKVEWFSEPSAIFLPFRYDSGIRNDLGLTISLAHRLFAVQDIDLLADRLTATTVGFKVVFRQQT